MWFGEPRPSPGKRITYQSEHVGSNKLKKGDRVYYGRILEYQVPALLSRPDFEFVNSDFPCPLINRLNMMIWNKTLTHAST